MDGAGRQVTARIPHPSPAGAPSPRGKALDGENLQKSLDFPKVFLYKWENLC